MVKGKMNATIYKDILDDNLLQRTPEDLEMGEGSFTNRTTAPENTVRITKEWLLSHPVNFLE